MQTIEVASTTRRRSGVLGYLSLFTSLGTLLCCALPSLLVLLGLGATVATVLSSVPWLVKLSHHKVWVFTIAGVLIVLSVVQTYAVSPRQRTATENCTPDNPTACSEASRFSKVVLWIAVVVYGVGFFVAYVLGPILTHSDAG
jgi:mercuric ion transport protein